MPTKTTTKKETKEIKVKEIKPAVKIAAKKLPYTYAVGKRKTATARVRFYSKDSRNEIMVNEKSYKEYFPTFELQKIVEEALQKVNMFGKNYISIKVQGGGKKGQAEAVRHGIARALLKLDEELKKTLKSEGYLTRDSRKKERKKPGLKRARRAPQWSKR
ncbi:MAG: 30S ribosomal protein S9 [Candidatus Komeilibacteria bacterium CG10_big_fil_rev_8_21_14_0_10_41_13]|uniref:Small ribosomal subunit protein uS9 n=1 Tax=Candidatus Komeilibacteria bacterium CG10_big_fil_rev_8_21_14_0_10_41_13 TaxID=1974476 RepID=A0A2M6WD70_9BACT|nr:MAG: 30S ribosomal protein S9 [Candidatus Komeilibacteria bacterium CG10_big_fil_rev_8_21_14_0_10_41_13]